MTHRPLLRGLAATLLLVLSVATTHAGEAAAAKAEAAAKKAEAARAALERLTHDVQYLASDELEGRGVGTKGLQKAAEFVRDEFKALGLESGTPDGSYFQKFDVVSSTELQKESTSLVLRGPDGSEKTLELGDDFHALAVGGSGKARAPLVFAGYGISAGKLGYDDYADADVKGKILVLVRREPQQDDEDSPFDGKKTTTHSYIRTKVQQAKKNGAAAVLFVNDAHSTVDQKKPDQLVPTVGFGTSSMGLPFLHVERKFVDELLQETPLQKGDRKLTDLRSAEHLIDETLEPMTQPLEGWSAALQTKFVQVKDEVENVVGVLEGEGPLAEQTVIVGAHYDHLGYGPFGSRARGDARNELHNGADDNASGTAAMLEIARRFATRGRPPKRRIVFIAFGAEERGLIGSNYYVKNPLFPLEKTVAMVNFDMIGRLRDDKVTVMGAGTAKQWEALLDAAAEQHGLKLNKVPSGSGGSDQAAFVGKDVPVMFFFTGTTKEYHTPDDDFDTLNLPGLQRVVDLAYDVTADVVDLPERPQYVQVQSSRRRGKMAYLGVVPDYAADVVGLKLNGVKDDSPASKGGLEEGDVVVKMGDVPVAGIQGLADALRKYKGGQTVDVTVKRGDKKVQLKVKLGKPQGGR